MKLGDLEPVPVREVWPDEARDFTPWLAEHASLLGAALGIDLELVASEVAVGRFSADLVLLDTSTGRTVVAENMFGNTDHDHLGKLLTYVSGLDAACAILIAERFRPEHLSALNWLNASSIDEVAFFGVEVELWRIGDSTPAPRLNVVAKPDSWSRDVRPVSGADSTTRSNYRDWWEEFLPVFQEEFPGWSNARAALRQNWMNFPAGRTGLSYGVVFGWPTGSPVQKLRVELYIDPGSPEETDRIFEHFLSHRVEIEGQLGQQVDWQELEGRRASRIALVYEPGADPLDRERWPEYRRWSIEMLGKLRDATKPLIQTIP